MADVFLSYVREDRPTAEKLAGGLSAAGFSVWWDRHIQGGLKFAKEIERELDAAGVVVVLWSAESLNSEWVRDEAEHARGADKLLPVRLDGAQPPLGFRQTHTLDFAGWDGDSKAAIFSDLVASVRHFVGHKATPPAQAVASSIKPLRARSGPSTRRTLVVAAAAIGAGVIAVSALVPQFDPRNEANSNDGRIEVGAFEPLRHSDELEYFGKGVVSTMVRVLATNGIRTVALQRADSGSDGGLSGDAEFAVRGHVDRDGGDLIASADVVDRAEQLVLWSLTKKRDAAEAGILQEEFSAAVASVLACALRYRSLSDGDPSKDLFAQYLRLCEVFRDGPIEQAPELTRRIVKTAPQNALSYELNANASAHASIVGILRPAAEIARLRTIVYENARIAVEMDPRFDAAYARAIVVDPEVGTAERERLLQLSIAEDADYAALIIYANLLHSVGRIREARINYERAVNQNPLDQSPRGESAFLAAWLGRIEVARREFEDMRGKVPELELDWQRLWAELWFGDPAIAKTIHDRIDAQASKAIDIWGCVTRMVDAVDARERLSEAEIQVACGDRYPVYAYFGHLDATFRAIDTALAGPPDRINTYYGRLFLPSLREARADPRFMPLVARLGLVDYWLETDQWPDFCATEELPYDCKTAALATRTQSRR